MSYRLFDFLGLGVFHLVRTRTRFDHLRVCGMKKNLKTTGQSAVPWQVLPTATRPFHYATARNYPCCTETHPDHLTVLSEH